MTLSPLIVQQSLKRIVSRWGGGRSCCGLVGDTIPAVLLRLFVLIETSQTDVHNRASLALVLPSRRAVLARCGDF